jgi:CheY-like chemotaxis protein
MSAPEQRGARPSSGVLPRPGRVLVVDDEPLMGRALSIVLSDAHRVDVVTSAKDALGRLLWGERYDVILSDITMPEMNGVEFHDAVARVSPAQARRIVFVTGGVLDGALHARIEASGRTVLEKPVEVDRLLSLVDAHVGGGPPLTAAGE